VNAHAIAIDVCLALAVSACWIGVVGMLRMRTPTQALHYLTLPATIGAIAVTLAVWIESGIGPLSLKTSLIALLLLGANSVVTHAIARAFRTRELGHWEPCEGDPIEFVPSSHHPAEDLT
jgi:monovalent cation/proton antiporter MnhG/PhaG subunit